MNLEMRLYNESLYVAMSEIPLNLEIMRVIMVMDYRDSALVYFVVLSIFVPFA